MRQIASIVAEGELLHITTASADRYTITHRLHALESRLDPRRFVRLGRGTLAALDLIQTRQPHARRHLPGHALERAAAAGEPPAIEGAARDTAAALRCATVVSSAYL